MDQLAQGILVAAWPTREALQAGSGKMAMEKAGKMWGKCWENGRNHGCLVMKVCEVLNLETTPGT